LCLTFKDHVSQQRKMNPATSPWTQLYIEVLLAIISSHFLKKRNKLKLKQMHIQWNESVPQNTKSWVQSVISFLIVFLSDSRVFNYRQVRFKPLLIFFHCQRFLWILTSIPKKKSLRKL
jgi:hypothetical protein